MKSKINYLLIILFITAAILTACTRDEARENFERWQEAVSSPVCAGRVCIE